MSHIAVCRKDHLTLYVETNPCLVAAGPQKRPNLRLVSSTAKPRVALTWRQQPWVHLLSMVPVASALFVLLDAQHVMIEKVIGINFLGGVLLALLA